MPTYLKFANQPACIDAFAPYLITDPSGDIHMPTYIGAHAVDVVGVISKPTGQITQGARGPVAEFAALDGWHVNLSGPPEDCPLDLQPYIIDAPTTPSRVFAGG